MNGMAADRHGHYERVKELVRQHWNRRAADFDVEASHGLLTDAQAHAWRRLISDPAGAVTLGVRFLRVMSAVVWSLVFCVAAGGLAALSSSIAVVGTGLDIVYPARNRDLAHRLAEEGALISEFALGTPALASNFPRRNRLISGLASGCLVVEAALKSGSLITARYALEQGREVFAVPGSIHSSLSKGCHLLIKQGAKLVESSQDILEELGAAVQYRSTTIASADEIALDNPLLAALGFDPIDLDTLCQRSGLTPDTASAMLLTLELEGVVSRLPGGKFQRVR